MCIYIYIYNQGRCSICFFWWYLWENLSNYTSASSPSRNQASGRNTIKAASKQKTSLFWRPLTAIARRREARYELPPNSQRQRPRPTEKAFDSRKSQDGPHSSRIHGQRMQFERKASSDRFNSVHGPKNLEEPGPCFRSDIPGTHGSAAEWNRLKTKLI